MEQLEMTVKQDWIAVCDTGTVNFMIAFFNTKTFKLELYKHNFKVNYPQYLGKRKLFKTKAAVRKALQLDFFEYHKERLDKVRCFAIENNHPDVIAEVKWVAALLPEFIYEHYPALPVYRMNGGTSRRSYNIPPNLSHRKRKKLSADSLIFNETQNKIISDAFDGKVDDAHDAVNLLFAIYRKYLLCTPGQEWQKIKVQNILLQKRIELQKRRERRKRKREELAHNQDGKSKRLKRETA